MPHFYVKPEDIIKNTFTLYKEQAHYISCVRRFKEQNEIALFDGKGNSYKAKITFTSKDKVCGEILSLFYKMPKISLELYTAIPKGARFEWLVEKCAEIGVCNLIALNAKRSNINSFSKNKLRRYEKVSISASSQCGRNDIMKISDFENFNSACLNAVKKEHFENILLWESEEVGGLSIKNLFSKKTDIKGVNIFIGPEGGFENEEISFAKSLNIKTATLGENILRIETAAISAAILVLDVLNS